MKVLIVTILLILTNSINAAPADDFVITVKTYNPGAGTSSDFIILTRGNFSFNYNVDCDNDGTDEATAQTSNYTCSYPTAGIYSIRIKDNTGLGEGFPTFSASWGTTTVEQKLLSIEQWGTGQWLSMTRSFDDAINLTISATDTPDFSKVTTMRQMFTGATLVNPDTSNWDTSMVTDMSTMFEDATSADPDMSQWDVSGVAEMIQMFLGVTLSTSNYDNMLVNFASQNLQSNVTFHGGNSNFCSAAAQIARASLIADYNWTIADGGLEPTCTSVNILNDFVIRIKSDEPGGNSIEFVIETAGGGYNYNVDCDNDGNFEAYAQTGNYTCDYSVSGAGIYTIRIQDNSGIGTGYDRPIYNSSNVRQKILSIEQWGTALWSNMNKAFNDCDALVINATDTPNLTNVSNFRLMFSGATLINPDTSNWNMSSATDIAGMFRNTVLATPNTSNWDTSQVMDMSFMFNGALAANPDVSLWDTSNVTDMSYMFAGAMSANPVISGWDVSSVTNMDFMLEGLTLPISEYDAVLTNFNVQNLKSNVDFDAGNSQYCSPAAEAARANMVSFNGWNITDGGWCDIIFSNDFESTVVVFKIIDEQFIFDFSDKNLMPIDETPKLIAKGLDLDNQVNVKIYLRQLEGELEIMQSQLLIDFNGEQIWSDGLWYEVIEQGLSTVVLW